MRRERHLGSIHPLFPIEPRLGEVMLGPMNLLAHSYFADPTPESLLGNLLADFVKGSVQESYSFAVRAGIQRHREVDRFTDSHPIVRRSSARIISVRPLLAPVAVDIIYDHFLARSWSSYSPAPLADHAAWVYSTLESYHGDLPPAFRETAAVMARENWLVHYADLGYIGKVLHRMSRRLKGPNNFGDAFTDFQRSYAELEADFKVFFAEARERFEKTSG